MLSDIGTISEIVFYLYQKLRFTSLLSECSSQSTTYTCMSISCFPGTQYFMNTALFYIDFDSSRDAKSSYIVIETTTSLFMLNSPWGPVELA